MKWWYHTISMGALVLNSGKTDTVSADAGLPSMSEDGIELQLADSKVSTNVGPPTISADSREVQLRDPTSLDAGQLSVSDEGRKLQLLDTTPPVLIMVNAHAFIFHFLVTVSLNEDGTVWCGAVLDSGSGTVAPSAVQMKGKLAPVVGQGSTAVTANTNINMAVVTLTPGTIYDVYCYAEDSFTNGMNPAAISATKQEGLVTASGGDYNRPTLTYVAPYEIVESTTIKIYVQLDEDGIVWCVAMRDAGSGTTEPTSAEIQFNFNVDAWGAGTIVAQNLYIAEIQLSSLLEGSTYDVYCFARDVAGNGIDNTPAWTRDESAISGTKRTNIVTDTTLQASAFFFNGEAGSITYRVEPATWNPYLPNMLRSGNQERRDLESWNAKGTGVFEAWLRSHADHPSRGCTLLPVATPGWTWYAVVKRGGCTFLVKALQAYRAGYQGLIVINTQSGGLPDMTAHGMDETATLPSWVISHIDGTAIVAAINAAAIPLSINVEDVRLKPRLGEWQSDSFGARLYATS